MANGSWGLKSLFYESVYGREGDRGWGSVELASHVREEALIVEYLLKRREGCNLKMKLPKKQEGN